MSAEDSFISSVFYISQEGTVIRAFFIPQICSLIRYISTYSLTDMINCIALRSQLFINHPLPSASTPIQNYTLSAASFPAPVSFNF
jgi:hypothetical protein